MLANRILQFRTLLPNTGQMRDGEKYIPNRTAVKRGQNGMVGRMNKRTHSHRHTHRIDSSRVW